MSEQPLPDTRLAAITWIRAHPDLPAGVTVAGAASDSLAAIVAGTGPYVAVYRPPGPPSAVWVRFDHAVLNVQAWASTEEAALTTVNTVVRVLHEAPGRTVAGAVITAVRDLQGPGLLPDPNLPDLFRATATVTVTARAE